ncbi:uncharacterized protein LOC129305424 [Prosopis cineraria]|uniref:uncharacterized protein LOC129305424 n=1 Tax=Prosopis cineraria TaxID=364024 RepID=UPI00240F8506|nr:uncharacterized protein LOC129305424 [Prosopis cineraria]
MRQYRRVLAAVYNQAASSQVIAQPSNTYHHGSSSITYDWYWEAIRAKKLTLRYIGLFEILERIRPLAYRIALPPHLSGVHDMFHVSQLKKYQPDLSNIIQPKEVELLENLTYRTELERIADVKDKQLKNKTVCLVKVIWKGMTPGDAAWEMEEKMR